MTSPSEVNVTFRLPAATLNGPATSAVLTPFATESPSTETSSTLPGKPWTTNISAGVSQIVGPAKRGRKGRRGEKKNPNKNPTASFRDGHGSPKLKWNAE